MSSRRPSGLQNPIIERIIEFVIRLCGWSSIFCVAAIFVFILVEAAPVLPKISWFKDPELTYAGAHGGGFFTSLSWHPEDGQFGALGFIVGNISVALVAMLLAIPFGLGAAVFISEFATGRTKEWLKIGIEILAAIPSIVWGFVGLTIISPMLIKYFGASMGINLLNGAILLALMSVPLIVSIAEDALRAVPDSYREAALALGANRWELVRRVLFPAARNGLMAACMLGVGRAIGETMAVLLATGNTNQIPHSLLDPIQTLTAVIAGSMGEASAGGTTYRALFVLGLLLLVITAAINIAADRIIRGGKNRNAA